MKKKVLKIYSIIIFLFIILIIYIDYKQINYKDILSHYNDLVITNKETSLYKKEKNTYKKIGNVSMGIKFVLNREKIDYRNKFFQTNIDSNKYYIYYEDVKKTNNNIKTDNRYKKYILFNENVITKKKFKLYDKDNNKIFEINKSLSFPIIIKETDKYGIEFDSQLLYINKEDVDKIIKNKNTEILNTNHVGVLNYHFFWDDNNENKDVCNQIICHSKKQFKEHLNLIKEMNLLTLTMKELEMYIDGKIQLPPSIVITIDDGWRAQLGIDLLNEYQMYGTLFLITGSYNPEGYKSKYVEIHSHTNKLHNPGLCPGGQGSGIKCLKEDIILEDLKESREKLYGSTVFCYPFYEYNDYAVSLVQQAGFKMAFAGENNINNNYIVVGSDKYRLPRYVINTNTTINDLIKYFQ